MPLQLVILSGSLAVGAVARAAPERPPTPRGAPKGPTKPAAAPKAPSKTAAPEAAPPAPEPPPPSPAEEATRQQVRTLVREAGDLLGRGDKAGAVAKLKQAQILRPDPTLDYNLGVAYLEWGKAAEAAASLERFLAAAPAAVMKDRLDDARQRLDGLRPRLGRVSVQLAPGEIGAGTVLIDNRTLGPAPVKGHYLEPGAHEVRVTAPGARDFIVSLPLGAGEERAVSALLTPLEKGGLAFVPQAGPPPDPPLYKRWWFWTAVGGGVALAAGLIGAGAGGAFNRKAPGSDIDALDVAR